MWVFERLMQPTFIHLFIKSINEKSLLVTLLEKSPIPIGIIGYFFAPWHSTRLLPGYKPMITEKDKGKYPGS